MKIPFNIPFVSGDEVTYLNEVIANKSFSYPRGFSKKCELELSKITGCKTVRLTVISTSAYTHYSPLHLSDKGKNYPYFCFEKDYSKIESDRLLRLPLFFDLELDKIKMCVALINQYFRK